MSIFKVAGHYIIVVVVIAALAGVFSLWLAYGHARDALAVAEAQVQVQRNLNDSTVALLALRDKSNGSLHELLEAANRLNGKLIAGVTVNVPARDTVIVHDTTVLLPDSTRVLRFKDSTFAGTLVGSVTAPPCCQPLALTYTLSRPAFSPHVGFAQVGNRQVAIVTWQGEQVQLDAPYFNPSAVAPRPRVVGFVEAGMDLAVAPYLGGGVRLRVFGGWNLQARLEQLVLVGEQPHLLLGVHKEW